MAVGEIGELMRSFIGFSFSLFIYRGFYLQYGDGCDVICEYYYIPMFCPSSNRCIWLVFGWVRSSILFLLLSWYLMGRCFVDMEIYCVVFVRDIYIFIYLRKSI